MEIEIQAALMGASDNDERTTAMMNFCQDFESVLPLLAMKHKLGVGDTLCAVLSTVGKTADLSENREPMAAILQKWAEMLRDPKSIICVDRPAGHA